MDRVIGRADLDRAVLDVENAADRLVRLDLLALDAEQLRKASALSGIDQIIAGRLEERLILVMAGDERSSAFYCCATRRRSESSLRYYWISSGFMSAITGCVG